MAMWDAIVFGRERVWEKLDSLGWEQHKLAVAEVCGQSKKKHGAVMYK